MPIPIRISIEIPPATVLTFREDGPRVVLESTAHTTITQALRLAQEVFNLTTAVAKMDPRFIVIRTLGVT
jgi:hypothetical protein